MENAPVIIFVGVLVFLAHLFVAFFQRARVPDVLSLILIGIVIGPMLGVVHPEDFGEVGHTFTTIALVVILFEGGLELSFASLRNALRSTMLLMLVSYGLAWALITALLYWLTGFPFAIALLTGAILAGPAPTVIIPLARQLHLEESTRTVLTLESVFGEAFCLVVSLAVLEAIRLEEVEVGHMLGRLLSSFVFAMILGVAGGYAWSLLLHRIRRLQNAIFTTPSFVFILFGICEFLGFSGPIAALSFGVTIGNAGLIRLPWLTRKTDLTPIHHNEIEKLFFGEIVFLLKTFFFVYLGISIRFADIQTAGLAMALTGLLILSRMIGVRVAAERTETTRPDATLMASMVPKGLATAVLASLPLQLGLAGGGAVQSVVYNVVLVSVVATGLLVFLVERTAFGAAYGLPYRNYRSPAEAEG